MKTGSGIDTRPAAVYFIPMRCIVTAGPTYEPLDEVRRLTNFSTGRLGIELSRHLAGGGHEVILLLGEQATWPGERRAALTEVFTTTRDLRDRLARLAGPDVGAVFHAAAVSDFTFGRILERGIDGGLTEVSEGKLSTRRGTLLAELLPTPKLISELRGYFPNACLVGWKYEVDGDREGVLAKARQQIGENRTSACVANGRAYGDGFGLVTDPGGSRHASDRGQLFGLLDALLTGR